MTNYLRSETEYEAALALIRAAMDLPEDQVAPEARARFEYVVALVEAWERGHTPVPRPSAEALAAFYRDQARVA